MADSPATASLPSAQRIKKREVDRRCQRLARQRTKSRLAHLEALVADFEKNDASGRTAALMKQIQDLTADKDKLVKALRSVQNALDASMEIDLNESAGDKIYLETPRENDSTFTTAKTRSSGSDDRHSDEAHWTDTTFVKQSSSSPDNLNCDISYSQTSTLYGSSTLAIPSKSVGGDFSVASIRNHDHAQPQSPLTGHSMDRLKASFHQVSDTCHGCDNPSNIWRWANDTLMARPVEDEQTIALEDSLCEEVPILGLIHGWDYVRQVGKMTPSWEVLSLLDSVIFQNQLPKVERLAVLRVVHILMMYHIDPSPDRVIGLPTWYFLRPSQTLPHSYAADYLAWPGVRERFVFFEHRYCTNDFWDLFNRNMRLCWPFSFRDCYTINVSSNKVQLSSAFSSRLKDINVWAMGTDFFERFPELRGDIPVWGSIPGKVDEDGEERRDWKQARIKREEAVAMARKAAVSTQKRQNTPGQQNAISWEDIARLEQNLRECVS